MKDKIIIFSIILAIILSGCGDSKENNSNAENNDTEKVDISSGKNAKEKEEKYGLVTTDKARLRQASTVNSDVLAELPVWSELIILDRSNEKESIGENTDYWYKVNYEDTTGWCFGALLTNIDEVTSQEIEMLKKSFDDCNSFYKAKNILKAVALATKDRDLTDIGVRRLLLLQQEFGDQLCSNTLDEIDRMVFWRYSSDELNNPEVIKENDLKEYIIKIKEEGFRVNLSEGNPGLQVNPKGVLDEFDKYISDEYREFLKLKSIEIEQPISDEGFILITWDELGDRLAKWADFMERYPGTLEAQDAKDEYYLPYLYIYTNGTHNTQIYDERNRLIDEAKDSYRYFINTYKDIEISEKIKGLYELLNKNKFEKDDIISTYIEGLFD